MGYKLRIELPPGPMAVVEKMALICDECVVHWDDMPVEVQQALFDLDSLLKEHAVRE